MSEFNSQTHCAIAFPTGAPVGNDRANRQASINKQSVKLPECVSSTVHHVSSKHVQQQPSHLSQWRSVRQMQCRLLILVCLLLGLSLTALIVGVINLLTLHSLQEEVTQHQ